MEGNQVNLFTVKDFFEAQDKNEVVDIKKKYDPLYFWDDYGDKYLKSFKKSQEVSKFAPWLVSVMKGLNIKTLYDAGCGFCRLEPFLLKSGVVEEVTAIDISQKQLDSAEEYLKDFEKRDKITIKKQSIKWSNTPPNSYDCTMSVECMQHLHLPSVRYAVKELEKLTRRYVVIVERFLYDGEHPFPHLWSHNYHKLTTDIGLKILESRFIGNGVVAMVLEK